VAELCSLRTRIAALERGQSAPRATTEDLAEEVQFSPAAAEKYPHVLHKSGEPQAVAKLARKITNDSDAEEHATLLDRFFACLGKGGDRFARAVSNFFTGGNLVLRVGMIVLFVGVSFLIKYAAQRNLFPLEFRLAAAALGGLALVGIGWKLRLKNSGYGLVLQGGGIGILYLVVFGAGKLYGFLPMSLAFVLMVALVALSCLLALLQDGRSLAFFGTVGGFLAPVLMSTGNGSHVVLFSYFGLLNIGILAIAWFKAWRELNLLGFLFTFGIGTLWGSSGYQPVHFWTTEPFLLLFYVFYVLISVLFAFRQQVDLRGFIDGPLIFGLPLVVSALQYFLVKDFAFGMAFSALGFGGFYLLSATLIWKRVTKQLRLLCETFLALGIIFASLAIPLGMDGRWSGAIWALEGAGMVWVGARQARVLARHFGLLLQAGAGVIFLSSVHYPYDGTLFANQHYLGCFFLASGALASAYVLDKYRGKVTVIEQYYPLPLLIVGNIWWHIGGLREVQHRLPPHERGNGLLLYLSATSILFGFAAERLRWMRFHLALLLQLPGMVLLALFSFFIIGYRSHLLHGWGALSWPIAFFVLYRVLYSFCTSWPLRTCGWYHTISLWLLTIVITQEASWAMDQLRNIGPAWTAAAVGLIPVVGMLIILRLAKTAFWPVGTFPDTYLGAGAGGLALGMISWLVLNFVASGNPRPLPYIPVMNPIELVGLAILITLLLRAKNNLGRWDGWRNSLVSLCFPLVGCLLFGWLNAVVARSVHFYAGIGYYPSAMFTSTLFQAAIAALWGLSALALTIWATRQRSRTIWLVGAFLLGMTVLKLFLVDLSGSGTVARIVSFLVVGVLMLIIGYFSPIPPKGKEKIP
jgi:uncharacterized membrane protein